MNSTGTYLLDYSYLYIESNFNTESSFRHDVLRAIEIES